MQFLILTVYDDVKDLMFEVCRTLTSAFDLEWRADDVSSVVLDAHEVETRSKRCVSDLNKNNKVRERQKNERELLTYLIEIS